MCGIFGSVEFSLRHQSHAFDRAAQAEKTLRIVNRLQHRGPDDVGVWHSPEGRVALGHRRLSLVGVDAGKQPICNHDHSIVAVVNGEFYGHREIRRRLENRGHRFQLRTDSEIAVHLYREFGLDFIDHLRGEFSLLLWDEKCGRLIAVRDRFGIKPLVYHRSDDSILFSSEAKAILPELKNASWDTEAFCQAARLQYLAQDATLFEGIKLVPPGFMAIVENNELLLKKYWDMDYENQSVSERSYNERDQRQAVVGIHKHLKTAVLDRLDADVPVCFHLSGGLDSSCALGIASQESGKTQDAFTICFDGGRYDELDVAQRTASFCGARLHPVRMTDQNLIDHLLDAASASEGLAINGHLAAKYLLNQSIRKLGFKAAITGEGADETFLGYAHLRMDWWNSHTVAVDQQYLRSANQSSVGMMIPHGDSLPVDSLEKRLGFLPTFLQAKATLGFRNQSILSDDIQEHWRKNSQLDAFANVADAALASGQLEHRSRVHQSTWLWSKLAMAGYILKTLGDGCEMASSIEGRLPFLDHHLFEYVRGLPLKMLLEGEVEKQILRLAVQPYVTSEVFQRPKHPFDTPPLLLSESPEVLEFIRDQVSGELFRNQPFYEAKKVNALLDRVPLMNQLERQVWDPVITMMISTLGIQQLISRSIK